MGCASSTPARAATSPRSSLPFPAPLKSPVRLPQEELSPAASAPFFTTRPSESRPLLLAPKGPASALVIPPMTLPQLLDFAAQRHPSEEAFLVERPVPPPDAAQGPWTSWTYSQYLSETRAVAKGLLAMGVCPHEGVTIQGSNQPEAFMAMYACTMVRAVPAGVYPSDSPETCAFKARHVGAQVAFCETVDEMQQLGMVLDQMPRLRTICVFQRDAVLPSEHYMTRFSNETRVDVLTWAEVQAKGQEVPDAELDLVTNASDPSECAVIIFTSGTTGLPKAAMLSHDALVYEARIVLNLIPALGREPGSRERCLSYLPLSHVAALMVDAIAPVAVTAFSMGYASTYCARAYDLKKGTLADRMRAVRPTLFIGVPRMWEKMQEKVEGRKASAPFFQRAVANWAFAKGLERERNFLLGGSGAVPGMYDAADSMVLRKVKQELGLDACKYAMTAAAPISRDTLSFFGSLGISINEVYGATECAGACTMSTDQAHMWGSVGFELPGCSVRVLDKEDREVPAAKDLFNASEAEQGEICFRGRNLMLGYAVAFDGSDKNVVLAHNEEAFTSEGFCRSGDKGCRDERGLFRVTGRFKELIKTTGGEYVSPVPIEEAIVKVAPAISKCVVIGDKRKYSVALITLVQEGATGESPGNGVLTGLAKDVNPQVSTTEQAMDDVAWETYVSEAINKVNADGDVCRNSSYKVQKFMILPNDLSIAGDEMTPTLKLKRSTLEHKWAMQIEDLYASSTKDEGSVFANFPAAYVRFREHASGSRL